jgi:CheY-like chemotaxis protein
MNLFPKTDFPTGEDLLAALVQRDHEVRTSLTTISWAADLLSGTTLDGEQAAYVDALRRASEKLFGVLDGHGGVSTMVVGRESMTSQTHPADEGGAPALDILMAEDAPEVRMLFAAFLGKTRHRVDFVPNGAEAVERCRDKRYDLVIMDMQMPVMDGCSATRAIRSHESDLGLAPTPILALTAQASESDVIRCLEAGCTSHLAKPVRKADLLRALRLQ